MSFTIANWACVSGSLNQGQETVGGVILNAPNMFTYGSPNDTVAQISAADYFLSEYASLSVGDLIFGHGTDASFSLTVLTVSSTGVTTASTGLGGAVGTANLVNNAVTSAKMATNLLQYATVAITAAEFNGMFAAPKLLVAAAGANTLLVLDKMQLLMTYNSVAYATGGTVAVQYGATVNGAGVIASSTLANTAFAAAASTGFNFNAGVVPEPFATTVNAGLYLSNIGAAFTLGNSPMVAHLWYKVIATV